LALADYDQEIELNPDYVLAYSSRGSAYLLRGELELAMADLNRTIELDPESASAYVNRGVVLA
jgi:tetratricopeptide (TPR) repeat protein